MKKPTLFKMILLFVGEFVAIALTGIWLLPLWWHTLLPMIIYLFVRNLIGMTTHFKMWYLCFVWSYLLFLTLFLVGVVNIWVALILSAFFGLVTTNRFDITDMFAFKKDRKYIDFMEYVRGQYISNIPKRRILVEFEYVLQQDEDVRLWMVYQAIFVQGLPFYDTAIAVGITEHHTKKITDLCDKIAIKFANHTVKY